MDHFSNFQIKAGFLALKKEAVLMMRLNHLLFALIYTSILTMGATTLALAQEQNPNQAVNQNPPQSTPEEKNSKVKVEKADTPKEESVETGEDVHQIQIKRIEEQVNELKEEVFRTRSRLSILKETVLASGLSGAEIQIIHRNEMGANFKLERILYILDGTPIRRMVDENGKLDQQEEIEILDGPITPGNHSLQVELIYCGHGYGVFSYLQAYRFTLNDIHTFRTEENKKVMIKVVGYEKGGVTVDLKDRPDLRFEKTVLNLDEEASANTNKAPNSNK